MNKNFFEGQKFLQGDVRLENLKIDSQIGRGNSDVYLAHLGGNKIAVKQTQIKNDYQYQNFLQEISMLKNLSENSNVIIKYEGYFVSEYKNKSYGNKRYGYLLMQRATMNLAEFVKAKNTQKCRIGLIQLNNAIQMLINGFCLLESMNVAHCDIKPQNILVIDMQALKIRICDVGSCKIIDKQNQNQNTIKGTLSFLAPELIKIQATKITSINPFRSDVYSFGLVILYLITGRKFTSQQRKQVNEEVYFEIIQEWIKYASEVLSEEYQITEILKKSLESDPFKRPLFKELKTLYESLNRKKKILHENQLKKLERKESQVQSVQTKKQTHISEKTKTKFPKLNGAGTTSTTLISLNSRQRLTGKISVKTSKNTNSNSKSKKSTGKNSKSKLSPFQKTTMYSTFSIDKSKISIQTEAKKIIHITNENYSMIPYDSFVQDQKIFVLLSPNIQFENAMSVVIKKQCSTEVFDKLCHIKNGNNLYIDYASVEIYGTDENTSTINSFESIYINLEHSSMEGGYNNFLRCLCPIGVKSLSLQLTQAEITYQQVKMQLERLKNKELSKLDLCWDKAPINADQFSEMNEKISKLPLRKLIFSLGYSFLKAKQNSRWPLPNKCKILYLSFPSNFLSTGIGSLGLSLSELGDLKQLYINLQNNCLSDIDIKVLIKSLKNIRTLEKAVLNFSWNEIAKGFYCLEDLLNLNKISSLELRLAKCGISFEELLSIFRQLFALFNENLKILKITYERKITSNALYYALEKVIKQQNFQGLKVDVIGYDYSYYMIYVKKKSQGAQKTIKLKIKQYISKNPENQLTSDKKMDSSVSLTPNKALISHPSIAAMTRLKQEDDDFSCLPSLKQISDGKIKDSSQKICQALFTTYPTYECYICLGCIENKEMAKFQYFCRACIENCEHKGHHIVRTYEKKVCNCPYNQKCHFRSQENSQFVCAEKLGIKYKKQYQCQKCTPKKSFCQGCITLCKQNHPQWLLKKPSSFFQCHTQSQTCSQKQKKSYFLQQSSK